MKSAKRVLSIMMAIITLVSVMSVSAEALSVVVKEDPDKNYGYMVPINYNGTEVLSTVKVYGSYDYINLYIRAYGSNTKYFFYSIYSDKKLTKCVESNAIEIDGKGTYSYELKLKLKGKYKTKTYYLVTYAATYNEDKDRITIDAESMRQSKIAVDRTTSFSKQKVMLKEVKNTTKGAYIKWSALSGTNKYDIYRRSITGTKWTKVGSVSKSKTSFTDTSVKSKNANYIYTVKAVNKKGTVSRYHYSGLVCLYASTPVMESINVIYNNTIELKWGKTSSKAKYNIMRKEDGGDWKTIKTNYSSTTYKDKTAENGKKYTYSVKAVISTDYGKAVSSYYANSDMAVNFLNAPALNDVAVVENGVNVSWNVVEGVSGYSVLRRPLDKSEGWTEVGLVDSTILEFTDTTADLGGAYIYTVRSEGENGKGSYYSAGREFIVLDEPKNVSHNFNINIDCAYISWEVVEYATQYNIYVTNESGDWELYKTVDHDSDGDTGYRIGSQFATERTGNIKYAVTALRDGGNETPINNIYEMEYYPWVITNSYISIKGMVVNWKDRGAQSYNIYRLDGDKSDGFVLIDTVDGTGNGALMEYIDETIEDKVAYTYRVKGVYNGVEQTTCFLASDTYSRLPESEITREEKPAFIVSEYSTFLDIAVSEINAPIEIYGYDYENDVWKKVYHQKYEKSNVCSIMRYNLCDPNENGEYTVSVVYNIDGNRTAFDANIITGKFLDAEHGEVSAKTTSTGVSYTFEAVEGAKEYVFTYTDEKTKERKEIVVKESGKKTYTVKLEFDIFEDRRFTFFYNIDAVLSDMNVSRRSGYIEIEKAPDIYKIQRNDDGTVTLYWDDFEPGISDYSVYRQAEGSTKWRTYRNIYPKQKKINGKRYLYWKDTKAEKGVKYTYKVIINTPYATYPDYDIYLNSHYELVTINK